jgi:hypothetical protein
MFKHRPEVAQPCGNLFFFIHIPLEEAVGFQDKVLEVSLCSKFLIGFVGALAPNSDKIVKELSASRQPDSGAL